MKLIPNASKWYRMFSVQALIVIAAIQSVVAAVPAEYLLQPVPGSSSLTWHSLSFGLTLAAAVVGAVGRVVDQGGSVTPPTEPTP